MSKRPALNESKPSTRDLNTGLRFGFLIHDVSRLRRVAVDRALKPLGITRAQWWVLAFLSRRDGMTQTALAADLDLTKVVTALRDRRPGLHVVVTGRNAKPALIAAADLVTEMSLVKHHFAAGVKAQPGIEF